MYSHPSPCSGQSERTAVPGHRIRVTHFSCGFGGFPRKTRTQGESEPNSYKSSDPGFVCRNSLHHLLLSVSYGDVEA